MTASAVKCGPHQEPRFRLATVSMALAAIVASCGGGDTSNTTSTDSPAPSVTTATSDDGTTSTSSRGGPTTSVTMPDGDIALISDQPVADEANYNGAGAVAQVDDGYVMFVNEYLRWPPNVEVHMFRSLDGIDWVSEQSGPLIDFAETGAPAASIVSSVIQEDDGSWTLFFYSYEGALASTAVSVGRATAPAPEGPWTIDPDPVLTSGDGWDAGTISTPTVLRTDGGYVMFYTGGTGDGVTAMGRADSDDGITWQRHGEPVFTGTDDGNSWDGLRVSQPNLLATSGGVVIVYKGNSVGSLGSQHGLACVESLDPDAKWERVDSDPILDPGVFPGGDMIFSTETIRIDGAAAIFASVARDPNSTSTDVYGLFLPIVDTLESEGTC